MPKQPDRAAEIRERVARRKAEEAAPQPPGASDDAALAAASAHFLGAAEALVRGRTVERIPVGHIAPDTHPERRQPRLLPLPDELMVDGQPNPRYADLVAELLELGQSLKERQIQPVVVYAGTSETYPAARYLLLVGHRRWTAASLVGLETVDAVVAEPPTAVERVAVQYAENEARAEFSDMERAWSLTQMKRALGDAPWEQVEAQFNISRTRRHELTRLLAFTPSQQQMIALLRMQETQLRPLHAAVRAQEMAPDHVDRILKRLGEIAAQRAQRRQQPESAAGSAGAPAAATSDDTPAAAPAGDDTPPQPMRLGGIDGPTVARLVAQARRTVAQPPAQPLPRWFSPLRENLVRATTAVQRSQERAASLSSDAAATLLADVEQLVGQLAQLTATLADRSLSDSLDIADGE
jgi:ParB family chromosome partitioning protein